MLETHSLKLIYSTSSFSIEQSGAYAFSYDSSSYDLYDIIAADIRTSLILVVCIHVCN